MTYISITDVCRRSNWRSLLQSEKIYDIRASYSSFWLRPDDKMHGSRHINLITETISKCSS